MRARSGPVSGRPSSSVNANRPPAASAPEIPSSSGRLSANASIVSSRSTTSNVPRRERRHPRDLEAAGQAARACACDVDGARAVVDSQVAAAQLPRDEPPRPGHSAAEVEHGHPAGDAGPLRQRADLPGAHEALLLDVLARGVGRLPGSLQGLDERNALVLPHDRSPRPAVRKNRFTPSTVPSFRMFEYRGTLRSAQGGPLIGLAAQVLLLAALAATVGLGLAGWLVGLACGLAMDAALAYNLLPQPLGTDRPGRVGDARAGDAGRRRRGAGRGLVRQVRADRAPGGARGRRAGARLRRRIRRAAHRDGVDPGRALGRRGRRVPDPRARRLRRPIGRRVGAPDRRGTLRVPGRRVAGRVDARAAAPARLAQGGRGDAGRRAGDRGSRRPPARPHPRRPRRRARPARRVVRPRRLVAVEPPVGARPPDGSGAGAGCRRGCRTRTRPRGHLGACSRCSRSCSCGPHLSRPTSRATSHPVRS